MKNRILAIGICVLILLVVFSSGCIDTEKEDDEGSGWMWSLSLAPWNKTTDTNASAFVLSTTPFKGIEWVDITWHLYNNSTDVLETGAVFTHYLDGDNDGYLKAGDKVKVTTEKAGTYKVRAICGGSVIYESAAFTL